MPLPMHRLPSDLFLVQQLSQSSSIDEILINYENKECKCVCVTISRSVKKENIFNLIIFSLKTLA